MSGKRGNYDKKGRKQDHKCEYETELNPYAELGYRIVEKAVQDYVIWVKSGKKREIDLVVGGRTAEKFLDSKWANTLSGVAMDTNIKEMVDEQLRKKWNFPHYQTVRKKVLE